MHANSSRADLSLAGCAVLLSVTQRRVASAPFPPSSWSARLQRWEAFEELLCSARRACRELKCPFRKNQPIWYGEFITTQAWDLLLACSGSRISRQAHWVKEYLCKSSGSGTLSLQFLDLAAFCMCARAKDSFGLAITFLHTADLQRVMADG